MKKINEDIAITDPNLANQYANGKQQLVNKDAQINALNKQILKLQQDKIKIQQVMDQIEKKSAENAGTQPEPTKEETKKNTDLETAQKNLASQILMNSTTSESVYSNSLNNKLKLLKENILLESNETKISQIQLEIDKITSELNYLAENYSNPFSKDKFYNLSESYEEVQNYLLYVEVKDRNNKFVGKIFKRSPESKWFGKVIYGTSKTFENITYEEDYEEDDILNFLMDTYDNVRILSIQEFNQYSEEDIFEK